MSSERYRLKSPTMAVQAGGTDGRMFILKLPKGAVVEVTGNVQQSGLIDVRLEGRIVAMFLQDLEERGEKIRSATAQQVGPE